MLTKRVNISKNLKRWQNNSNHPFTQTNQEKLIYPFFVPATS